jgi:hypothetical protein
MREELDRKLCEKYPDIFKDRRKPMNQTAMCWGFQHGDGWYDLLDDLCKKLTVIKKLSGIGVVATTVKEKFGGLRFYIMGDPECKPTVENDTDGSLVGEIIHDLIGQAASRSHGTCEECGEYGERREWARWEYTRCYGCWKKAMKEHYGWDIPDDESEYDEWEEKTLAEIKKRLEEEEAKETQPQKG